MITDSSVVVNFNREKFLATSQPVNAFFYKNCILCDAIVTQTQATQDFCDACFRHLPAIPARHCPVCLRAFASDQPLTHPPQNCGSCLSEPPAYDTTIAALTYTFPVDALIHALKYQARLAIAPILAKLLIEKLRCVAITHQPDLIIPMPLHPKRLRERGFNQAIEIARDVARALKTEMIPEGCKRIQNTPPQAELPWKLRRKNVRNAFSCTLDLSGRHVAIIDDVMTTGATLNALAHQLRIKGAATVSNWVIARAQIDRLHPTWTPDF